MGARDFDLAGPGAGVGINGLTLSRWFLGKWSLKGQGNAEASHVEDKTYHGRRPSVHSERRMAVVYV